MDFNLNFHPLDNLIKDKTSFWLEALVPFVDYKYKKLLIIYIKYKELNAILDSLEDLDYVESCGFNCKAHNMEDVINGLTGFMPKDFSDNINQMKSMLDMMKVMNQMDGGMSNANPFMNLQGNNHSNHNNYSGQNHHEQPHNHNNNFNHSNTLQSNDDLFENIKSILDQE